MCLESFKTIKTCCAYGKQRITEGGENGPHVLYPLTQHLIPDCLRLNKRTILERHL